jgi:hypothetical protein
MSKITSKSDLNVGTELTIDESTKTFTLNVAGNLVAKDGVTLQALYSKFVDLWTNVAYQDSPFPMYAIDILSGQLQFGTDGSTYSGWKPANDATRQMLRDGGWSEWSAAGVLNRVYAGFVGLGTVNTGAQPYYQLDTADAPTNFTFDDQFNIGVQVYGDASNVNFEKRTYAKTFCREYGKIYVDSILADTGRTSTEANKVNFLISNQDDLKITVLDSAITGAPYSGIDVTYYDSDQMETVGISAYPFRVIIDGNDATLEQIYNKVQYLLRQDADIDSGAGTVNGRTADSLLAFVGDNLITTEGVFIDNILPADTNRVTFTDYNGVARQYPYVAAGALNFNSFLIGAGSVYRLLDANDTSVTIKDNDGVDITGTITSSPVSFSYDYDALGTDKDVLLVSVRPGYGKYASATGTLTRSKAISISVTAEQDRAYSA